jgi:glycosyltransferase involved in cell wall biosynthesis
MHMHVKYENWLTRPVRFALSQADRVVCVSQFVAESVVGCGIVRPERIRTVHNALKIIDQHPDTGGASLRSEFYIEEGDPLLVIVGRLNRWKGQADLIKALPLVKHSNPTVKLLVVGDEDALSNGYRAELEGLVNSLGLERNVIFTGQRRDVPAIMAAADLFVCPTWEEPFGMVFLEAMAQKKAVVAIRSGAAPEIVVDGETGCLVAPKDTEQLANAINALIVDRLLAKRLGAEGRARVESEFAPSARAADLARVYQDLVSEH